MTEELHKSLFFQLVAMLQMAAMQQLGKLVNPMTGETDRDLDQAKGTISLLEMLEAKTSGNRDTDEEEFLSKVLFELRMNYVDESKRPDEPTSTASSEDTTSSVDSPQSETEGSADA